MNEYINYYDNLSEEELMHYGVVGMKWGVRRAQKTLSSKNSTDADRKLALDRLEKHRVKANAEVAKLQSKRPKLEERVNKKITKHETKAAELADKAAKHNRKAYGFMSTKESSEKHIYKANKLQAKADAKMADIAKAKSMLAENDAKTALFKKGLKDIDKLLVDNGRKLTDDLLKDK